MKIGEPTKEDLWKEIHLLRHAIKGPDGFETWQDAATAERVKRVAAEKRYTRQPFDTAPKDRPIIAFDSSGKSCVVQYDPQISGDPYPWRTTFKRFSWSFRENSFTTWAEIPE